MVFWLFGVETRPIYWLLSVFSTILPWIWSQTLIFASFYPWIMLLDILAMNFNNFSHVITLIKAEDRTVQFELAQWSKYINIDKTSIKYNYIFVAKNISFQFCTVAGTCSSRNVLYLINALAILSKCSIQWLFHYILVILCLKLSTVTYKTRVDIAPETSVMQEFFNK
jgi:hypothetical protein